MPRHLLAQNQDRLHKRDASEINKAENQVYATGSLKRSTGAMLCKLNSFLSPTLFEYEQRSIENRNCYGRICIDSIHSRNRKKILQPIQYERSRNYCWYIKRALIFPTLFLLNLNTPNLCVYQTRVLFFHLFLVGNDCNGYLSRCSRIENLPRFCEWVKTSTSSWSDKKCVEVFSCYKQTDGIASSELDHLEYFERNQMWYVDLHSYLVNVRVVIDLLCISRVTQVRECM